MQADTTDKAPGKIVGRSKVTNRSKVGTDMDGRTQWVRRLRDLIEAHEQDLGGSDNLNQSQRSLVRRAATLSVELERMEAGFATAGQISADDLDSYQRASNTLRRHLEVLGLRQPQRLPELAQSFVTTGEGGRKVREIRDDITMYGVCVGRQQSKYETARRIAFAVARAKETGEPVPDLIADLAVQLRLADYADGDPVIDAVAQAEDAA
ncbi:hypothetical protein [Mesorhizobium helmanticense]|uniref:hypothetical protein n=1 Tax=Mesorhizobium helmanticense TaxID=1776423 RepID=UPI001ABF5A7C|nr:hypothetical protein [Mesorhizobium helmanticense]